MKRESYKKLYMNEKNKKLQLEDAVNLLTFENNVLKTFLAHRAKEVQKLNKKLKPWI